MEKKSASFLLEEEMLLWRLMFSQGSQNFQRRLSLIQLQFRPGGVKYIASVFFDLA